MNVPYSSRRTGANCLRDLGEGGGWQKLVDCVSIRVSVHPINRIASHLAWAYIVHILDIGLLRMRATSTHLGEWPKEIPP